jgi:hypothetical protein
MAVARLCVSPRVSGFASLMKSVNPISLSNALPSLLLSIATYASYRLLLLALCANKSALLCVIAVTY